MWWPSSASRAGAGTDQCLSSKKNYKENDPFRYHHGLLRFRYICLNAPKGPQEPHCPQLDGKAQTIMQPTAPGQVRLIGIIEMEVLGSLDGRGFPHIAAIVLFLTRGKKADGHTIHGSQDRIRRTPPFCRRCRALAIARSGPVQKSLAERQYCASTFATQQARGRSMS